jgi:excisionase family DNA binding protein
MAQGMATPGGGGAGGFATEMAVGMAMAQQLIQQQGGPLAGQATPAAGGLVPPPLPGQTPPAPAPVPAAAAAGIPDLLSPADAAQLLGVSEGDVMQTLESGELKGRKIGSTWRITRGAIDQFLAG